MFPALVYIFRNQKVCFQCGDLLAMTSGDSSMSAITLKKDSDKTLPQCCHRRHSAYKSPWHKVIAEKMQPTVTITKAILFL